MRHVNIPVFIPHLGCPNLCVFCNQKAISGKMDCSEDSIVKDADRTISEALKTLSKDDEVEIAFFGGSFTGIGEELMKALLDVAQKYIDGGMASYIRMSTRPDYINDKILCILRNYSVKYIELGIQSMNDVVLDKCKRGHTSLQSRNAVELIKKYGFYPVGQMMTALPYSTPDDEINTAKEIVSLGCVGCRIYPTMVFSHTELEKMVESGEYIPPELDDLTERTARVLDVFIKNKISVLKVGLHSGEALYSENGICCGTYHPAMGELVEARVMLNRITAELDKITEKHDNITITVAKGFTSKTLGHKGYNKDYLIKKYGFKKITVKEDEIENYSFRFEF